MEAELYLRRDGVTQTDAITHFDSHTKSAHDPLPVFAHTTSVTMGQSDRATGSSAWLLDCAPAHLFCRWLNPVVLVLEASGKGTEMQGNGLKCRYLHTFCKGMSQITCASCWYIVLFDRKNKAHI